MKYSVVIFPSKKLQDQANSYRMRYDLPNYALITPHMKLKNPFEICENKLKSFVSHFKEISNQFEPFELEIYKVKSFHPVNNVIYLAVKQNDTITGLHQALHEGELNSKEPYSFIPHITVGSGLSNQEHSDVIGQLGMMHVHHTETIDRFHLMYQLENESWTVYETFRLGKENE